MQHRILFEQSLAADLGKLYRFTVRQQVKGAVLNINLASELGRFYFLDRFINYSRGFTGKLQAVQNIQAFFLGIDAVEVRMVQDNTVNRSHAAAFA